MKITNSIDEILSLNLKLVEWMGLLSLSTGAKKATNKKATDKMAKKNILTSKVVTNEIFCDNSHRAINDGTNNSTF